MGRTLRVERDPWPYRLFDFEYVSTLSSVAPELSDQSESGPLVGRTVLGMN
jgi:hypothetical protein